MSPSTLARRTALFLVWFQDAERAKAAGITFASRPMGLLIENANEFVTASADLTLEVILAGLAAGCHFLTTVAEEKSAHAEQAATQAEKDRKEAAIAYRNLGAIAGLRDPKGALEAYEKAASLDPGDICASQVACDELRQAKLTMCRCDICALIYRDITAP